MRMARSGLPSHVSGPRHTRKEPSEIMQHRNHTNWLVRAVLVSFAAACVPLITGGLIVAVIALGVDS